MRPVFRLRNLVVLAQIAVSAQACHPPRPADDDHRLLEDPPAATAARPPADPWRLNEGCDAPPGSRRSAKTPDGSTVATATCRVDLVLTNARVRSLCVAVSDGRVDFVAAVQGSDAYPNIGYRRYNQRVVAGPSCNPGNCGGVAQPGPEARVGAWFDVDLVLGSRRPIGMNEPPKAVPPFPELRGRARLTADGIEMETPEEGRVVGQCRDAR